MSLFSFKHPPISEPELSPAMKARLDELDEKLRLQDKAVKTLELDWQEWFDKFRLLYARLSKRIRDAAQATENGSEKSLEDSPQRTIDPIPSPGYRPSVKYTGSGRRNY